MKRSKVFFLMLVTLLVCSFATLAFAGGYNPFDNAHKAEAKSMRVPGQATMVVSILNENNSPIEGATLHYYVNGELQTAVTDANGIIKATFTSNTVYTYKTVEIGNNMYVVSGKDLTGDFDADDLRKGDVNWDVLRMEGNGFTCYDAD